jgi:hypothetical protein
VQNLNPVLLNPSAQLLRRFQARTRSERCEIQVKNRYSRADDLFIAHPASPENRYVRLESEISQMTCKLTNVALNAACVKRARKK